MLTCRLPTTLHVYQFARWRVTDSCFVYFRCIAWLFHGSVAKVESAHSHLEAELFRSPVRTRTWTELWCHTQGCFLWHLILIVTHKNYKTVQATKCFYSWWAQSIYSQWCGLKARDTSGDPARACNIRLTIAKCMLQMFTAKLVCCSNSN